MAEPKSKQIYMEDLTLEQVVIPWRKIPWRKKPLWRTVAPGKKPQWRRFIPKDCSPWRTPVGTGERCEEKEAAKQILYVLITAPKPIILRNLGQSEEVKDPGMKEWSWVRKKRGKQGGGRYFQFCICHYCTLFLISKTKLISPSQIYFVCDGSNRGETSLSLCWLASFSLYFLPLPCWGKRERGGKQLSGQMAASKCQSSHF